MSSLILPYEILIGIANCNMFAWNLLIRSCKTIYNIYKPIPKREIMKMFMEWKTKHGLFHSDSYWEYIDNGIPKQHVVMMRYDTEGRILQESEMWLGRKWGKTVIYYRYNTHSLLESNCIQTRAWYEDDKLHGRCLEYHDNGVLWSVAEYDHGVLNGPYYTYYDNGYRHKIGYYENGISIGEWIEYSRDGGILRRTDVSTRGRSRRLCVIV